MEALLLHKVGIIKIHKNRAEDEMIIGINDKTGLKMPEPKGLCCLQELPAVNT